eukprot:TRINITY_DN1973_c0_g2_i1.p1 TRINITY_DN1973_c0_g2~~TRINITY_DN1973_c0_g2_i1.p1  ORF type:complete len:260 (+),score=49.20 TRINITY_DN1973_c0_g2_i1:164-943(+)
MGGLDKLSSLRILNLQCNQFKQLKGLSNLVNLRDLKLSNNSISNVRELQYIQHLEYLSELDLCFNRIQNRRYYRYQVLFRLPGLRVLDGQVTNAEEFSKAENLYGLDLEDRKKIFLEVLPDEEFIDRRINMSLLVEEETDSDDNENIQFIDKYDSQGNIIKSCYSTMKSQKSQKSQGSIKSKKNSLPSQDEQEASDKEQQANSSQPPQDLFRRSSTNLSEAKKKINQMRAESIEQENQQMEDVQKTNLQQGRALNSSLI